MSKRICFSRLILLFLIVPQTLPRVAAGERAGRYWFWPMGIAEPGAMRQWGRHATAFVRRRHFDDVDLFEKYFDMKKP